MNDGVVEVNGIFVQEDGGEVKANVLLFVVIRGDFNSRPVRNGEGNQRSVDTLPYWPSDVFDNA